MRRETQNLLLLLLGGALLKITLTGDYLRYVKPALHPWLIGASVMMVLLAVIAIARDIAKPRDTAAGCGDGHRESRSPWMLLLPVLAIFIIAPPALGSDAVNRAGSAAIQQPRGSSRFAPLPADDVVPMRISEFVTRAMWEPQPLRERNVRLTGFIVHDQDRTLLARIIISCCAADGTPFTVQLVGADQQLAALPNDTWVNVTGQLLPSSVTKATNDGTVLTVSAVETIPPPAQPYDDSQVTGTG